VSPEQRAEAVICAAQDGEDLDKEIASAIRAAVEAEREACALEAERNVIEYAEIDVLDKTDLRDRIARRIRARGAAVEREGGGDGA